MPYGARVGDQLLLSVIDLMPFGYDLLAIISMKSIYFPSLRRLSFIILVTRQPLSYAIYLLFKHSPMIIYWTQSAGSSTEPFLSICSIQIRVLYMLNRSLTNSLKSILPSAWKKKVNLLRSY